MERVKMFDPLYKSGGCAFRVGGKVAVWQADPPLDGVYRIFEIGPADEEGYRELSCTEWVGGQDFEA